MLDNLEKEYKMQDDQVAKEGDTIVITRIGSQFKGIELAAMSCPCVNQCKCSAAVDRCAWFIYDELKRWAAFGDYRVVKRNQSVQDEITQSHKQIVESVIKRDDLVAQPGDTIIITRQGSQFEGQEFTALKCTASPSHKMRFPRTMDDCAWFIGTDIKRWVAFGDYRVVKRKPVQLDIKDVLNFLKDNRIYKIEMHMNGYAVMTGIHGSVTDYHDTSGDESDKSDDAKDDVVNDLVRPPQEVKGDDWSGKKLGRLASLKGIRRRHGGD